jgi:hypothetical protein
MAGEVIYNTMIIIKTFNSASLLLGEGTRSKWRTADSGVTAYEAGSLWRPLLAWRDARDSRGKGHFA